MQFALLHHVLEHDGEHVNIQCANLKCRRDISECRSTFLQGSRMISAHPGDELGAGISP